MSESHGIIDALVLGGGAAGLMCAIEAGRRGLRVVVLEHNDAVGRKIRISGGGRCNFTNVHAEPVRYLSSNPRFCHSALSRYTPQDFLEFVGRHRIAWHEKKLGQLFCDGSAQAIIDALLSDCAAAGVHVETGCAITGVHQPDGFVVESNRGTWRSRALVVATGGLSIPKLGATGLAYEIARQFAVPVTPCVPGLVPLTLPRETLSRFSDLSGISFAARASVAGASFDESVLITHRGLSGPAILQISSYWTPGEPVRLNLFPDADAEALILDAKRSSPALLPAAWLRSRLPARFAQRLCAHHGWIRPLGESTDSALRAMARYLTGWEIPVAGTEGYGKAEVTRGGIDTRALSPKSMEVKACPGLYFIGEAMDVTGWLGGYNFQWAWASGAAAGRSIPGPA